MTPARFLTDVLKRLLPDLDVADGDDAETPKMVNNSKVRSRAGKEQHMPAGHDLISW